MNRRYFFLTVLGFLILYPTTSWLMMLFDVLRWGQRLIYEPDMMILYLELSMTIIGFFSIIFLIFWFYINALKS